MHSERADYIELSLNTLTHLTLIYSQLNSPFSLLFSRDLKMDSTGLKVTFTGFKKEEIDRVYELADGHLPGTDQFKEAADTVMKSIKNEKREFIGYQTSTGSSNIPPIKLDPKEGMGIMHNQRQRAIKMTIIDFSSSNPAEKELNTLRAQKMQQDDDQELEEYNLYYSQMEFGRPEISIFVKHITGKAFAWIQRDMAFCGMHIQSFEYNQEKEDYTVTFAQKSV